MRVLGDALLDADGVLHGWCWDPAQPDARLNIEILVNDDVTGIVRASNFREDMRALKYGDGNHGFTVTLSRQVAQAKNGTILCAREQRSGVMFWRRIFGNFAIPADFSQRLGEAKAGLGALGWEAALTQHPPAQAWRTAFAALGTELQAKAGTLPRLVLPLLTAPRRSVIADAGNGTSAGLARLAPQLKAANAEVILAGSLPGVENLLCLDMPGMAARFNLCARAARGSMLVFADLAAAELDLAVLDGAVIVPPALAAEAAQLAPQFAAALALWPGMAQPGLRLAVPSALFKQLGGFNTAMDDGAGLALLDFLLRALWAGVPVQVLDQPWEVPYATPSNAEAGRRFAQSWALGLV